eukprot:CAMPEP_0118911792 /NCGR_PEP_ID=MMETSP1166-20130328/13334_1 /TAXON_ID=1104430 /ORGANISM="Chrysoreinhardia sp, Strain CCMP3193" /LENGTH=135 /DNA_ID=CAMNT_0006851299 /DNA_START=24 /DNA_END=429 /DNA_ORIENTATION=-
MKEATMLAGVLPERAGWDARRADGAGVDPRVPGPGNGVGLLVDEQELLLGPGVPERRAHGEPVRAAAAGVAALFQELGAPGSVRVAGLGFTKTAAAAARRRPEGDLCGSPSAPPLRGRPPARPVVAARLSLLGPA